LGRPDGKIEEKNLQAFPDDVSDFIIDSLLFYEAK